MINGKNPFILLKNIPSERYTPYKDRHIPIHARNQEVIKKRLKTEKKLIERNEHEKLRLEILREKKVEKEMAAQYKLLNVI